jgi:hypothetical protein
MTFPHVSRAFSLAANNQYDSGRVCLHEVRKSGATAIAKTVMDSS